jgi:hypothetical protein
VENERKDVNFDDFVRKSTHFLPFFLEIVQKLIFVAISLGWEVFYHEEQIRAVIFIFSKDLGKFRKNLKS